MLLFFLRWHYPVQVLEFFLSHFDFVQNSTPKPSKINILILLIPKEGFLLDL